MEHPFKRLSAFITTNSRVLASIALIGSLICALLIFRLEFKTDLTDVLPSNDPQMVQFKGFLSDFGSAENLVVVVEAKNRNILENLDMVEDLAGRLEGSAYVESVEYNAMRSANGLMIKKFPLFLGADGLAELKDLLGADGLKRQIQKNKEAILSPISSPSTLELISKDPLDLASIMLRHMPGRGFTSKTGYFISKDNSMLLLLVRPKHPSRDIRFLESFRSEIDGIFKAVVPEQTSGVKIGITGPYAFAMEAHSSLKKEIVTNFLTSAVVIILLFQLVYRKRPLVLLITAATLLSALSYTLGAAYLLFGGLNMVSSVVAVMLLGMGIDYIIHIFNRWEEAYRETGDTAASIREAFTKVLPGVATGAVTTTLAFLSIVFTDFRGLYEFGIIAGIGVVSCLLMMVFFMCSCLSIFPGPLASKRPAKAFILDRAASSIIRRKDLVIIIGGAALAISAVIIPSLRFDSDPQSIGIKNSPVSTLEKKVSDTFSTGKNPLIAVLGATDKERLFSAFGTLEEKLKDLEESKITGSHRSLAIFLPAPEAQQRALAKLPAVREASFDLEKRFLAALKENGFKADEYQKKYITTIAEALLIDRPATLLDLDSSGEKRARIFYNSERIKTAAYIFAPGDGSWDDDTIRSVQSAVETSGTGTYLTGAPIMLKTLKRAIIKDSSIAAGLTFLMITAVVFLQFRSVKWALLIQFVLLADFILTLGVMVTAGIQFNYMNIAAVALILGIGVDYSVYVLQGYLEQTGDICANLGRTWKSVIMCALTTLAGFGSLMTMSFSGIASLGAVITIGVVICLITSLTILPAMIAMVEGKKGGTHG